MALGDPYCTENELREYCEIGDPFDDAYLRTVCDAISNGIEGHTYRQFNDAGIASQRVYYPDSSSHVIVDDFHTTTGLVVESGTGGTFSTTHTDYTLEPLNGVQHGRPGFPWRRIRLHSGSFPYPANGQPTIRVTARWGWAAVPPDVHMAALMQGARKFQRRYSPNGLVTVGQGDFVFRVSRIEDPDVIQLLHDFVIPSFGVA